MLFVLLVLFADSALAQGREQRVALVIGNAAYKSAPLRNPLNDSRARRRRPAGARASAIARWS